MVVIKDKRRFNTLLTPLWPQWLAAIEVFLLSLMVGMNAGWISPFIANLLKPNPPFEATKDHIVWVASLVHFCRPIGVIAGSVISYKKGSKLTIYTCGFYFLISWVLLVCANTIGVVFISLVLNGISQGTFSTIFPLYIGEISDSKIRGRLISFVVQGMMVGSLLGTILGTYLVPWIYAAINLVPSAVFILTFSFFPHTPHFLVRCNKNEEASKSIQWYNRDADVSSELKCLSDFLNANPKLTVVETLRKLNTPVNRKALLMMNVVYSFAQLTGLSTIHSYSEVLFTAAQITLIAPSSLVIVMRTIVLISSWVAVYTTSKFGRTSILSLSCLFLTIALFGWGLSYHFLDLGFVGLNFQWLTIVSSLIYRVSMTIGFMPVVPTILSEIFAPDIKNMAVCICNITNALFSFLSNKYFQFMIDRMTHKYVFYLLSVLTAFLGIYTKVVIPETKGKTLAEIQAMMNKEKQVNSLEVTKV